MIKIDNLTIRYPKILAVDNITLKLNPGTIYGLVGPNGAGKSSLLKCLVGLISNYDGEITYDDINSRHHQREIKSLIGYAPENPELFPYLTGYEYLTMISEIRQIDARRQIEELIKGFSLESSIDDLINRYSHGMRQKISLGAALIGEPKNLFLDEALNGFDPVSLFNAREMLRSSAKNGNMILISSHVLELMEEWCQEIIIMNKGHIIGIYTLEKIKSIRQESGKNFIEHFISLVQKDD